MRAPLPSNEASRLEALRHYQILDSDPEHSYDEITRIASFITGAPIAIVSLIDSERQWFKSKIGLSVNETPRDQAFCAYTIHQTGILEVEDATKDQRFSDNPLVLGSPDIRFYAGASLVDPQGYTLGSLCVIDRHPRKLSAEQRACLTGLASLVMKNMELRKVSAELAAAAANIKTLSGLLPICCACKQIRNDDGFWQQVEAYIGSHSDARFTHSYCPQCYDKFLKDLGQLETKPSA